MKTVLLTHQTSDKWVCHFCI